MLTRTRGCDALNPVAMIAGFLFRRTDQQLCRHHCAYLRRQALTRRRPGSLNHGIPVVDLLRDDRCFLVQSCSGRAKRSSQSDR